MKIRILTNLFFILNELYNVDCDFSVADDEQELKRKEDIVLGTTESREEA